MRDLVLEFLASGKSRTVFCDELNINKYTFKYWQNKLSNETSPMKSNFIKLVDVAAEKPIDLEIIYPNGVRLKLGASTTLESIGQFIGLV